MGDLNDAVGRVVDHQRWHIQNVESADHRLLEVYDDCDKRSEECHNITISHVHRHKDLFSFAVEMRWPRYDENKKNNTTAANFCVLFYYQYPVVRTISKKQLRLPTPSHI
jgi:hypothetical protein